VHRNAPGASSVYEVQPVAMSVREKIVYAALDRFHALGFSACSVQDIVDQAKVPKGSFYNYFKAKELLALEVMEIYSRGAKRETLLDKSVPPLKRLREHFEFLASRYHKFGYDKGCLLGSFAAEMSGSTPLLRKKIDQSLQDWTEAVTTAIREGQQDGSIVGELDAAQAARFLINGWEGAVVRMKIADNRQALDDFFAIALPLLTATEPKPQRRSR
jgi:TetR/AcrR family transcriptional repressor of nem operon